MALPVPTMLLLLECGGRSMTPAEHRELDAEVAAKVMGLTVKEALVAGTRQDRRWWTWNGEPSARMELLPAYSTDIAAAWLVVEKLRADGYSFKIYVDFVLWMVRFGAKADVLMWYGDAETAPLAIVRAALAVMEGEA